MSLSLRSLSNHELLSRTKALTVQERRLTLNLLLHLNEVERRKLFLKRGHASMFTYCTSGLGYSASAAKRRICTARCIARFPEVLGFLKSNDVNLSTVTQVSRILRPDNAGTILARIRGKSQREVEAIVAEYEPLAALPRERARTVVVRVPVRTVTDLKPEARAIVSGVPGEDRGEIVADEQASAVRDRNGPETTPSFQPAMQFERRAVVQFSAREEVMSKLEDVRALASHRLAINAPLEQLVEFLADYFIAREDPKARHERRETKQQPARKAEARGERTNPRQIPAITRDQVFIRDKQQCTFIGPDGTRCGSAHVLQVDHIKPVARGGVSTLENLRLLCAQHNRLEAERLMGRSGPSLKE
jgi:5-methylcytosine-specific restriction endonuclease McrA